MGTIASGISVDAEILRSIKEIVIGISQIRLSPDEVGDNANLFDDCGIDSTSVVELVVALEEKFNIQIEEDDLDLSLFQDISNLAAFVEAKTKVED